MDITYTRRLGAQRGFALETQPLSDRLNVAVNTYNGNLVVSATDLIVSGGIGPDLQVGRTYDSLATAADYAARPELGTRWAQTTAGGVRLDQDNVEAGAPRRRVLRAADGGTYMFVEQSTSGGVRTYKTPNGLDVTVTETVADNKPTLTEHQSQAKWYFTASGRADWVEDENGRKLTFNYGPSGLASISDSQGRTTTFTTNTGGRISKLTDPAGRDTTYTYTADLLTGVTDSSGKTSSFAYTGELVTKITTPSGRITTIEYFPTSDIANAGRVKRLTRVTASTTDTNPTWTFAYTVRRDASSATPSTATVIDPDHDTTAYEFGPDATGRPDARPTKVTDVMSSDGPSDSGSESKDIDGDDAILPEEDLGDGDGDNYDCLPEPDETFCGSNDSTEPDAEPPLDPGTDGALLGFSAPAIGENNWGLSDNNHWGPDNHDGTFDIFAKREQQAGNAADDAVDQTGAIGERALCGVSEALSLEHVPAGYQEDRARRGHARHRHRGEFDGRHQPRLQLIRRAVGDGRGLELGPSSDRRSGRPAWPRELIVITRIEGSGRRRARRRVPHRA